jgi:hypothetical protein
MQRFFDGNSWTDQLAPLPAPHPGPPVPAMPGWYRDSSNPHKENYWGGSGWTDRRTVSALTLPGAHPPTPPNTLRRSKHLAWVGGIVLLASALVAGGVLVGKAVSNHASDSGCARSSGLPLTAFPQRSATEPVVATPTPPGWVSDPSAIRVSTPFVRGILRAIGLTESGFTPNAVVTVEEVTGRNQDFTSEELLTGSIANLKVALSSEQISHTWGSVCGFQSVTSEWQGSIAGTTGTTLAVVASDNQRTRWIVSMSVQTRAPSNPDYLAAKSAMVNDFQVRFGSAG